MNETKKLSHKRRPRENAASLPSGVILGFAVALGGGLLLLLVFTLALHKADDPTKLSGALSRIALYIGCVAGGFASMKRMGSASGYSACAIAALATSAISLAIGLICRSSDASFISTVAYYAGIFAAFFAGAFIGAKRSARPKRRSKR